MAWQTRTFDPGRRGGQRDDTDDHRLAARNAGAAAQEREARASGQRGTGGNEGWGPWRRGFGPGSTVPDAWLSLRRLRQDVCPVGADGAVRLYTYGPTHLVADVTGWYV